MSSAPLLSLRNITQRFGDGEGAVHVLNGASLDISAGELVALVAPSGAGKSTLLHITGLLERPRSGEVIIDGVGMETLNDRERTLMRRTTIGYVYQFHHLLPEFSALENVAMPQFIAGVARDKAEARARELLDLLGVAHRATHRPSELSGGEQQRVAIARATANRPRIILADEPTGNLDPTTSDTVFEALRQLIKEQQAACIIATHNHALAKRADRIVTLSAGHVAPLEL